MISIGAFSFPVDATTVQVSILEAKSKVRKEIHIRAMLQQPTEQHLNESLACLRQMVEAFDRGEQTLSLHSGRYYMGRRRAFHLIPNPDQTMAWVDLLVLTEDRYERGTVIYEPSAPTVMGQVQIPVFNQGNWETPLSATLVPQQSCSSIRIEVQAEAFEIEKNIDAQQVLEIDAVNHQVTLDGVPIRGLEQPAFPALPPGAGHVVITTSPVETVVDTTLHYRDVWV